MRYWKPRAIPGNPLVTIVVASYLNDDPRRLASLQCLLASLNAQTYPNWTAIVGHDGPLLPEVEERVKPMIAAVHKTRISLVTVEPRARQFGHPHRHRFACAAAGEFVGFANDDGYYAPVYLEWLLAVLTAPWTPGCGIARTDLVHCDMVHSHQLWKGFKTEPMAGKIDLGCFLARKSLIVETPWTDYSFRGDGVYVEALVKKTNTRRIAAQLYVHN